MGGVPVAVAVSAALALAVPVFEPLLVRVPVAAELPVRDPVCVPLPLPLRDAVREDVLVGDDERVALVVAVDDLGRVSWGEVAIFKGSRWQQGT